MKPIEVILDTDIGGDIDDNWALGLLLRCPELRPRLILSCSADTLYRSALIGKSLAMFGHDDIPIGIGPRFASDGVRERLRGWLGDYRIENYRGPVFLDGIGAALSILESTPEPVIIGIGPMTNLAEICRRRPDLVAKSRLVAMIGSIARQHRGLPGAIAEFNVTRDIAAAREVWAANWRQLTITPLDTCGTAVLDPAEYGLIRSSSDPVARTIAAAFAAWQDYLEVPENQRGGSSILFDPVAVALAFTRRFFVMEKLPLSIDEKGFMRIDQAAGRPVEVALKWRSRSAFKRMLIERLTGIHPDDGIADQRSHG